jgi:hypothetical protein
MREVVGTLDLLLRSPRAVAERSRSGEDLRPLVLAALGALGVGAGIFGAVLATSRGGLQLLYSGVKLPLALIVTLVLVVPALTGISAALGRPLRFAGMVGLSLSAVGRTALVLAGLSPVVWFAFDRGLGYHGGVVLAACCYGYAGFAGLRLLFHGIGRDLHGALILGCCALVLVPTGAQTAWMLRPFLGRPAQKHVPFLRARESSFADAVYTSFNSSRGRYRRAVDEYGQDVRARDAAGDEQTGGE